MRFTIVGLGKIGRVFEDRARRFGDEVAGVTRATGREAIERPGGEGPIVVAVGEEDLPDLVSRIHPSQSGRLVFVQNGFVGEHLAKLGARGRGLLHFNASASGEVRVLLPSVFGGNEAARQAASVLDRGGIPSRFEPNEGKFRVEEIRKALWSCALGILAFWKKIPVGRLFEECPGEVEQLLRESVAVASRLFGVSPSVDDLLESLRTMAAALPDYPGSARALAYRNGYLARHARALRIPTPLQDRILAEVGHGP